MGIGRWEDEAWCCLAEELDEGLARVGTCSTDSPDLAAARIVCDPCQEVECCRWIGVDDDTPCAPIPLHAASTVREGFDRLTHRVFSPNGTVTQPAAEPFIPEWPVVVRRSLH
jgi:hypothetical protein